ncbi:MAG: branched-chain amino acid ABC transporter permease [Alphaproteobacteria bacterium]|nr:branched-chain amino acid ABC transporter permease [Alphaproteobacteria bacterium]
MDAAFLAQLVVNGLVIGMIYALLAMGLSLIFGVLEIVNFAHGDFYMLGAMAAGLALGTLGFGYWPTVAAVTLASAGAGLVLYEALLTTLRAHSFERSILLTLGVSMVLQNGAIYLFTATPRIVESEYGVASVGIGDVTVTLVRLFAIGIAAAAFVLLWLVLYRTRIGQAMRAIAQSREAALMVGIRPRQVARLAVILGIALAGVAGAALAPVYTVHPTMGVLLVFKTFAIIIIGGLGSLAGAAITAVALGVVESLIGGFSSVVLQDAFAFLAMIAVLLLRPQGLFGRGVRV